MSFYFKKQLNADAQEGSAAEAAETAAITNVPVETAAPVANIEIIAPVAETVATAHDDFDWSVDKRNVNS